MFSDLRYALRQLIKAPGFAAVAILTLALGIGANTAIFSVVNTLLFKPLPYPDSENIINVWETPNTGGIASASGGVYMDWEDTATQLEYIAAMHNSSRNLTGTGDPVRLNGAEVSADFLRVLGVKPLLGRDLTHGDDGSGGYHHIVILSHRVWKNRFKSDPDIIGKTVQLELEGFTVVGVLGPNALPIFDFDFLVPAAIRAIPWKQSHDYSYPAMVFGRLKPGGSPQRLVTELKTVKEARKELYPNYRLAWGITTRTLQETIFGGSRTPVLILFASVGVVLLIACANVANLQLARAASRQGEIAVRVALGASTGRIIRQLLTESVILSLVGGLCGSLLGSFLIDPLLTISRAQPPPGITIVVDWKVLCFSIAASALTGLFFGLFPALSMARPNLNENLKEGTRGGTGSKRLRLQASLIIAETALTVVLLSSAGLLLRSFVKAMNADTGFNRYNVLTFELNQAGPKAPTLEHRIRFISDVLAEIERVPGVDSAAMTSSSPMNGRNYFGDFASREDKPETHNDVRPGYDAVAGDFFKTSGIPLLRGRVFTDADNHETAPRRMIINQAFAQRVFGDEEPLGRNVHFMDKSWEVIGVVGNIRRYQLDLDPGPQIYIPQAFFPWANAILVRTHLSPLTLTEEIRRAVQRIDPDQPLANLNTLEQSVAQSLQARQSIITLLGLFSTVALALACIGIYGVTAYTVSQRTREMGIRIALGAATGQVVSLILRDGLILVLIGLAFGILGSLGAGWAIGSQLYQVRWFDPVVLTGVVCALIAAALLACWLPARRATRVNPIEALRAE
ncbi:MAG: ABC transporter permease [Nibricoccus sp.]